MTKLPNLAEMLKAGVHFGHQTSRWHPKMAPYIFGARNGVHIINLEETVKELEKTLDYVKNLAAKGKVILFVGTKKQAREIIKQAAESCGMPYITERWIGGLITNFDEVKRRLRKYNTLQSEVTSGEIEKYVKKEQSKFKKQLVKMDRYLSGIIKLEKMPDALYIADLRLEKTAVTEANRMNVPVVAVVDSNVNPTKASYVIPANDDAVNSIKMMAELMAVAVDEGKEEFEKQKAVMVKEEKKVENKPAAAVKPVAKVAAKPVARKEYRPLKKEGSI